MIVLGVILLSDNYLCSSPIIEVIFTFSFHIEFKLNKKNNNVTKSISLGDYISK